MNQVRNQLGTAPAKKVTLNSQKLHLPYYALLGLMPEQTEWEWLGGLHSTTRWGFRRAVPYRYEEEGYSFDAFYALKSRHYLPVFIKNIDSEGQTSLLAYSKPAIHTIRIPSKTLPNQLTLFPDEIEKETLENDNPEYFQNNPDDIRRWNEITAFMAKNSVPLDRFRYLLPIRYEEYEWLTPLLNHLLRVKGLHYRYIPGSEIGDDRLFYSIQSFQHNLLNIIYGSSGRYSSKERSS